MRSGSRVQPEEEQPPCWRGPQESGPRGGHERAGRSPGQGARSRASAEVRARLPVGGSPKNYSEKPPGVGRGWRVGTWRQDNGGSGLWAKGLRELVLWSFSLLNSPLSSHGYKLDRAPSIRASLVTPPGFLPLVSTFSNLSRNSPSPTRSFLFSALIMFLIQRVPLPPF